MLIKIAAVAALAAVIGGANWMSWRGMAAPVVETRAGDLGWSSFEAVRRTGATWTFPADLLAVDGERMSLTGVVFALPGHKPGAPMDGAVLAPPARFSCCGVSCNPRPELMAFVALAAPQPDPGRARIARVSGILRLDPLGGDWALSSLEEASWELLEDPK